MTWEGEQPGGERQRILRACYAGLLLSAALGLGPMWTQRQVGTRG